MSEDVKSALDSLAAFPQALKQKLSELSESTLRYRPAANEWSILEIVGHMIDVNVIWLARIRQMLATENPHIAALNPESVHQHDYQNKQLSFLLLTLSEQRAEYIEFVRGLRPLQLARTGQHPSQGTLTVADGIIRLANHDQIHTQQIEDNRTAFNANS